MKKYVVVIFILSFCFNSIYSENVIVDKIGKGMGKDDVGAFFVIDFSFPEWVDYIFEDYDIPKEMLLLKKICQDLKVLFVTDPQEKISYTIWYEKKNKAAINDLAWRYKKVVDSIDTSVPYYYGITKYEKKECHDIINEFIFDANGNCYSFPGLEHVTENGKFEVVTLREDIYGKLSVLK